MTLLFKLAFRNLARNRTRTLLNLTMALGAFASIVLFKGFSNYMLSSMADGITKGQGGHIQIATPAMWNGDSPKKKADAYISNPAALEKKIAMLPNVLTVGGRANAPVLLSNVDKTIGAIAIGFDPKIEVNLEKALFIEQGTGFSKQNDFEILVSAGLQTNLQIQIGQTISVVSQSLAGSMSSLDLEVRGIVRSGLADVDASTVYLPLVAAQKLLETDRVERVAILLKDDVPLAEGLREVKEAAREYPELVTKDWKETAVLFSQVTGFYEVQNVVVEIILLVLVFFGILNTIGMSVYERIGEIGTMRALGDRNFDVLQLLLLEGFLLGLVGVLIGIPLTATVARVFSGLGIVMPMPGASMPIPIKIVPVFADYAQAGLTVIVTCFVATLWPAQKAVRLSVVDALRANS